MIILTVDDQLDDGGRHQELALAVFQPVVSDARVETSVETIYPRDDVIRDKEIIRIVIVIIVVAVVTSDAAAAAAAAAASFRIMRRWGMVE